MKKIFVDTDVIIDVFTERSPHFNFASRLFNLIEQKRVEAFTSPVVLTNLFYILGKNASLQKAWMILRKVHLLVGVLPVDNQTIERALNSHFSDFEDAIQYYTALQNGIPVLVTRNVKDYVETDLTVHTPQEYLAFLALNGN